MGLRLDPAIELEEGPVKLEAHLKQRQQGMAKRNTDVPGDKRVDFRIGINLGDIIIGPRTSFSRSMHLRNSALRLDSKVRT